MADGLKKSSVFLTVNNNNGECNPWSADIIEVLRSRGCDAVIADSVKTTMGLATDGMTVIPVFDQSVRINEWSPSEKTARKLPEWVRKLALNDCAAIGRRGVRSAKIIERVTTQMIRMYCGGPPKNGLDWIQPQKRLSVSRKKRPWRNNFIFLHEIQRRNK